MQSISEPLLTNYTITNQIQYVEYQVPVSSVAPTL